MTFQILIADDHSRMRRTLRGILEFLPEGCICAEASNGLEAVYKVAEFKPDLVILDLAMPVMDGLRATREMRFLAPALPILLYTHYVTDRLEQEATEAGVRRVFSKSDPVERLVHAVKSILGEKGAPLLRTRAAGTA